MSNRVKIGDKSDYFGKESAVQFIPSGCIILDCALGGGWPLGRVVNIVGDKSTGKTLLAIEALANFRRLYPKGRTIYNETESAFDPAYAASLGIDLDGVEMVSDCLTIEQLFDHISGLTVATIDEPTIYVLDSLDALSDEAEMGSDFGAASYGAKKAQRLSKFFRQINKALSQKNFLLIFISQIRDNIGVTFGKKYVRSGGHALDFYSTHVVWLAHLKRLEKQSRGVKRVVGVRVKANIEKNKIAPPHRFVEFDLMFGYGVDDIASSLDWLADVSTLNSTGTILSEILPGATTIKEIGKAVEKLDETEFNEFNKRLDDFVRKTWFEIERGFQPKRKKYR